MNFTRLVTTAEGGSRFVQMDLPVSTPQTDGSGNVYTLSEEIGCSTGVIAELPAGLDLGWHVAPSRQWVVVMAGAVEVQTTDGQIRRFGKGDLILADDSAGRGHRTRVLEGPARLMFLRLAEDFDADRWTQC